MDTPENEDEINSLENQEIVTGSSEQPDADSTDMPPEGQQPEPQPSTKQPFGARVRALAGRLNIYMLLFALVILIAIMIVVVARQRSLRENPDQPFGTQNLTQETLDQLEGSETTVGDPKQILNVESNAVFSGKVLVRDSLDVAGTIKVGGALSLPGITVSGTSSFETIQANDLVLAGNASIQGQLNVQGAVTVAGGGTFGGSLSAPRLNIDSLQLNGDLQFNRHIDAGGGTPGKSNGSGLGSGGTSSVSGTDTAGTVTINTGGSPPAGCFITVTFTQAFNGTPHVVISPVGSAGAGLNYYVNRSSGSFSVCSTNPAPAGRSFAFDYIVID
jgi:cytoskeletal protein CcmA (bactofilin family)